MSTRPSQVDRAPWPCVLALAVLSGCGALPPVFPPVDPPILWPSSGDPARYSYVGRIEGEADLRRPRSFWRGLVEAVAGPTEPRKLMSAHGVAVAPGNVLYVADPEAHVVHRFDLEGREYLAIEVSGDGRPFALPIGLAVRGEEVLVADRELRAVTILDASGSPVATLGAGVLESPVGVAVGPAGRVYVTDVGVHKVRCFDPSGRLLFDFGGHGAAPGQFNFPTHVATSSPGEVFVSDTLGSRVEVFDADGRFLRAWGSRGDTPGSLSQPKGIACDAGGHVYVVDSHFENVQVFTPEGVLLLAFGGEGNGPGQFWLPVSVFADSAGRVWVGDSHHRQVQVFQFLGEGPTSGSSSP